ncbi:MAG: SDR family NAD(P)-dependent oxidoreductase [Solirubrobacterales bacterium]
MDPGRLDGRVALVTGAASGIGKATSRRLASEGASVVLTDLQDEAGESVASGIRDDGGRALFVHHDVSKEADWEAALDATRNEFGRLDILVNNAGIGDTAPIEETDLGDYEKTIAVDQTGVFLGMKLAAPMLIDSGHGSVSNISSIFGTTGGFGASPAYHAAKGAITTLSKNAALHWALDGIRVNSIHPGFIDTPLLDQAKGTPFEDLMVSTTPMGRLGRPEEVAAAIAYLAGDDASFVTGTELYVDGGYTAR